ncbi:MAG: hypothetical protein H6727_06235 [Myxococcales bacterium]|nr:hypothetical protein [Myxococcales bacterium]
MRSQRILRYLPHLFFLFCAMLAISPLQLGCDKPAATEPTPEVTQEKTVEPAAEPAQETTPEAGNELSSEPVQEATPEASAEPTPEPTPEIPTGPHTIPVFDKVIIHSTGDVNVRKALADFRFFHTSFQRVFLHVQLDTSCYPFEKWQQDPPPAGQNWPPKCDAFDRNFDFHIEPPAGSPEGTPAIELVRAITPFGGPLKFQVDLTDIANGLQGGAHTMRVNIQTYSDGKGQVSGSNGQWTVSAYLEVTPSDTPSRILSMKSLSNHNYNNKSTRQSLSFDVPAGAKTGYILYRVTGHGGGAVGASCIGPADEFCRRTHKLYLDDQLAKEWVPWRSDCDKLCTIQKRGNMDYCAENPCGSIQSVRAPRANWCPGSITPPQVILLPSELIQKPGPHKFDYEILNIGEGGTWKVSSTLVIIGP